MAKRSDFAQKLLDDLRLRKERIAASQNSKSSKSVPADAYAYSKHTYKGSREMKIHGSNGARTRSTHSRTSGGSKSLSIGGSSTEIVPFGRGQSSEQIGDLSMALAFALENGGKLRRMDSSGNSSMLGFLHQIGRRSLEVGKIERGSVVRHHSSSNRFPTLSHLHIKEISRGAQKLNQILRACSNGLNFDRYSIEIGKELLKGAMDLEESLRMLVNLQEASEYMISPQSKTRITLLDEDEDDDDNTVKTADHNQLARPRFSFDKPSRNSHYIQEVARTDLRQRLMALTYPPETTNFNHDKRGSNPPNSVSHKKSASYGSNAKGLAALPEQKNHLCSSKSKPENGKIPNVIAKLMGLDELPENENSKPTQRQQSSSKQKSEGMVTKKSAERSSTREWKTKDVENSEPKTRKQMQSNQTKVIRDTTYALQAEKHLPTHRANFEVTIHDGNPPREEMRGVKPARGSSKAKTDRHEKHITQSNQSMGMRKDVQDKPRKQDNQKIRDEKHKEQGQTNGLIRKNELQQMAPKAWNESAAETTWQRETEYNASMFATEMRVENRHLSDNQPNSPNDCGLQQSKTFRNFEKQDIEHNAGKSEWHNTKQKIPERSQKGNEAMSRSSPESRHDALIFQKGSHADQGTHSNQSSMESVNVMLSKRFPNNRHQEDLVRDRNLTNFPVNIQDSMNRTSNQNASLVDLKSVKKEKTSIPPAVEEKPVHPPAMQKVRNTKLHKAETPRKINELVTRRSGNPHSLERPQKHLTSILQEGKQKLHDKLGISKAEQVRAIRAKEVEVHIVKLKNSVARTPQLNELEELQVKFDEASNSNSPTEDEVYSLKASQTEVPNSKNIVISTATNDQQAEELDFYRDQLPSHTNVLDPQNEIHEGGRDITYPSQLENQKASKLEIPEPLTESENHLKQILIKSQLFLNTAEALLKLNIPFGILHAGSQDCHDEESKLILDCGYEVMKRKGQKQELSNHPFMKVSISSVKIKSLDELIKQLHKDFEKLKFYGRNGNAECRVEDYLLKMLEYDVYNWDLDVNCMWDLGWDRMMFSSLEKDDVMKDVERFVLNGLLDEVTRDLLPVF